ncbi:MULTISPECIES: carboxymuconolactone decarboxylase family protein [unclassified Nesterenkonia]|uniref:carboxymuconolactone decarboxylase family protein n=1 Tax=unclassified Nesterenkonia TaxID=2629769 RepID=UPI001F4C805F|nr:MULTISPECIES: carboxymuconolactone decarboxylase family protein [unclassified Nesterenkonia]MCH8561385.1 carboxymuconolactone decarboxylase family protein [Nesterenkonia sp. DZ6]MCH8562302.1 carboxymuconolactone decarboxylase family protein [Nesterenkonia sp. YGD6]MCH8571155.1 carboxymuconolactone decarboxylase family protein [Nesterenkonia sp. AY15]
MSRITVETVESAPENAQAELKDLEQKFGKVLNIHGAMASSPVVLQAYIAIQQVIEDYGTFDAQTREAIALAVGNVDECTYCQSAHTQGAKAAGLSEDQTVAIRRGDVDFDPKLAALLQVAREATAEKGNVKDATWQAGLDAGWSTKELTELTTHVALNLYTNYFNHMVETELDVPAAPAL